MTACDHGIRLDRYCGDCEWDWSTEEAPVANDGARWASVLAAIGLVALVVITLAVQGAHRG